jgi:hypothetical protein
MKGSCHKNNQLLLVAFPCQVCYVLDVLTVFRTANESVLFLIILSYISNNKQTFESVSNMGIFNNYTSGFKTAVINYSENDLSCTISLQNKIRLLNST